MNQLKKLILVQHCQSKHHLDSSVKNSEDKFNGLTAKGQEQAKHVAEKVRLILSGDNDFTLYSSDQQRAEETSMAIHDATGLEIYFDPGLREWTGDLEIHGFRNVKRNSMDHFSLFDWSPFVQGPTWREFHDRVSQCMKRVEKNSNTEKAIIVCHGGTLSNIVVWWLNLNLDALSEMNPFMGEPGSISILVKNQYDNNVVQKLNDTSHLETNKIA